MKRLSQILIFCFVFLLARFVCADGVFIPMPPLPYVDVEYHNVKVEIKDQIAYTHIDQSFSNPFSYPIEGTYVFPVPEGAVISNFAMNVDGEMVSAALLDKDEARSIYEDIVKKQKDPALLEYAGRSLYKASIYPIPGRGKKHVTIDYAQVLEKKDSIICYDYPLNTEKYSKSPLQSVSIDVNLTSSEEIKSIYSPTNEIKINRIDNHHATVRYEEKSVKPNKDFFLYYTVSEDNIGFNILTNKNSLDDGFFLGMLAPAVEIPSEGVVSKNIIFILDTSGSMSGEKIKQARDSLVFCLNSLHPEDRFNVISFSSVITPLSKELMAANSDNIQAATRKVSAFIATGSTDINKAVITGLDQLSKEEGPNMIIFLTDGLPTSGVTVTDRILQNINSANKSDTRVFVFGVGYDVDIHFLDKLSKENRGLSEYVRPSENIEEKVSNFYSKVQSPILTDLNLDFGSLEVYDVYPIQLPDLFKGSQLIILGRYKNGGMTTIKLSGTANGQTKEFLYEANFQVENKENDFIPLLWASRKIGYLLDVIRLEGEDDKVVEEIVKLSKKYGIMTEYTSFLVDEGMNMSEREAIASTKANMGSAYGATTGGWAVSQSQNAAAMQSQTLTPTNSYFDASGNEQEITGINQIGQKVFYNKDNTWVDSEYTEGQNIINVQVFSEAYFQLSRRFRGINQYLSQGKEVIVNLNDTVIQIGEEGKTLFTQEELDSLGADADAGVGGSAGAGSGAGSGAGTGAGDPGSGVETCQDGQWGDGDGIITPADALLVFQCYLNVGTCPRCADANKDGYVTPADAHCIFKRYLGHYSCLDE